MYNFTGYQSRKCYKLHCDRTGVKIIGIILAEAVDCEGQAATADKL